MQAPAFSAALQTDLVLAAFEAADFGYWEYNATTRTAFWSKRCKELFGLFTDREITYADWELAVHPEDYERAKEQAQRALKETGVYDEEYRTIGLEDGKQRWVRSIAKVSYDAEGKPLKMTGVLLETTKSKLSAVIAQESDMRMKLIADTLPQLVWVTQPDGFHEFYNRRWFDYTGLTFEQTKGLSWSTVLHPEDQQRAWKNWNQSLLTGDAYEIEYRIRRHDGEYRWFLGRALPLHDKAEKIVKWFGTCTDIHEQKLLVEELERTNTTLAESEKRFRALAHNSPDMITRHGKDFRYLYASPHIEQFTGVKPEDFLGKSYWEIDSIPRELCPFFDKHLSIAFEKKALHYCHYTAFAGKEVHLESRLVPEFDDEGGMVSVLVITTDITERKKAEDALAYQGKLLETVTENTTLALFLLDKEGACVYINEAAVKVSGYSFDEIRGKNLHDVIHHTHPDGSPYTREECPLLLASQQNKTTEGQEVFVHKKGHFYDVAFTARPIIFGGKDFGTVLEVKDITEEKKREHEIRENERHFQQIANSLPLVVWTASPDGKLTFINDQWKFQYGNSILDSLGNGWFSYIHPDDVAHTSEVWQQCLQTGADYEVEFRIRNAGNQYRWMLVRAIAIRDAEGRIRSWHGSNTDIEEKKQFEAVLEEKVLERTRELEKRTAELEQFTYVSHHDLQEPLRKITMFTEMVRTDPQSQFSASSVARLERMVDASRRMGAALRDVLDFASLSKPEQFGNVDLEEVIAAVLLDLELAIAEKKAKVFSSSLPVVRAVPHQMHQLFYNLLSNALKFTVPGQPPLVNIACRQLEATPENAPGAKAYEITVQDNGIGFEPVFADKIFQLFQRLHSKDVYPGTGIGLALCKKIVETHQGEISAESQPGHGATFRLVLPAAQV
jgi:PAS domain S-box-containing protein